MYCDKCGIKLESEAVFCINCGHKLGENKRNELNRKKRYVICLIGAIVVIGIIMGKSIIGKETVTDNHIFKTDIEKNMIETEEIILAKQKSITDNNYSKVDTNRMIKGSGDITSDYEAEEKEILYNSDKVLDVQPYSEDTSHYRINGDGSIAIGHDLEEQYIFQIQNGQKTKISDTKLWYVDNLKISYEGMHAACVMNSELYYIDAECNEISCIDNNVSKDGFILSPNGEVMVYLGAYNNKIDNQMFLYKQMETGTVTTNIGENVSILLSVNDNADAIFYIKADGKLYFFDGEKEKNISQNTVLANQENNCVIFNESCTEVLYLDGTMATRFEKSEGKAISFNRELKELRYCVPSDMAFLSEYSENNKLSVIKIGKQTLDKIIILDEALFYVEGNKLIKLTDNPENTISQVWLADDFKTVLCTKNESIYQYNLDSNNEKCIYQSNGAMIEFTGSLDLKEIYVRHFNEDKIVHIVDGIIQHEWEIGIMQGRYSNMLGEYIYSNNDGEIYILSEEGALYLAKSTWPWPIIDVGQGQIWIMASEKDNEGYQETFYSIKENREMNKIFSRK